jgi:hypothetical protein
VKHPHFGRTATGKPVHLHTHDYHKDDTAYARFNKKVAIGVTSFVGSMSCAWIFCVIALISLPAVIAVAFGVTFFPHWLVAVGLIALVAWVAQTFLQLVLLSIIIVGSNLGQTASDARAAKQFEDVEALRVGMAAALDRLDEHTEGGIKAILDAIGDKLPPSPKLPGSL